MGLEGEVTAKILSFRRAERQQPGEHLRTVTARAGSVELRTECTDGTIIQEFLTPEQAAEWADLVRDAAADALMRGDGQ